MFCPGFPLKLPSTPCPLSPRGSQTFSATVLLGNQLLDMSPSPGRELGSGVCPEKSTATVTHVQAWDSTKESRLSYLARPKINHQINYNK